MNMRPFVFPPTSGKEEEECGEEWYKCNGLCIARRLPCNGKCAKGWCLKMGNCINTSNSTTLFVCKGKCQTRKKACNGKCSTGWCRKSGKCIKMGLEWVECNGKCQKETKICNGKCTGLTCMLKGKPRGVTIKSTK